ncbi:MAG: hypothetical protein AB7N72_00925 [Thermoleophilia bacterium]
MAPDTTPERSDPPASGRVSLLALVLSGALRLGADVEGHDGEERAAA